MVDLDASALRDYARNVVVRVANHDRGWRMAYPARRLIRAGDRRAQIAIDAVWECWLYSADERWWTALSRWRRPADPASALRPGFLSPREVHQLSLVALDEPALGWSASGLAQALGRGAHPIAGIARRRLLDPGEHVRIDDVCLAALGRPDAVDFLDSAGIRPADPSIRSAYLLLTGQQQRFWELDPDQVLLARAYRRLPHLRTALRERMPGFGDLDPARIVDAALTGVRKTPAEISYVTRQRVRDHDWDGLWRFARDLSPVDAAGALLDADPVWRPPDRDGAALYEVLRTIDRGHLRDRIAALAAPIELDAGGTVAHGAFSADDRMLAVTVRAGERSCLKVFDLEAGTPAEIHELDWDDPGPVSFEGHLPVVCQPWPDGRTARSTLWRFAPGRRTGRAVTGWVSALLPGSADGTTQVAAVRREANRTVPEVSLLRRHGPPTTRPPRTTHDRGCEVLDTDPVHGRVAWAHHRITIADLGPGNRLNVVAVSSRRGPQSGRGLCLAGPERVVGCDRDGIHLWRLGDGWMEPAATRAHPNGAVVWVPYRNAVAVADSGYGLRYLDADTLEPQDRLGELHELPGIRVLWAARNGTGSHAAADWQGRIHVVAGPPAALAVLARQPMGEAGPVTVPDDPVARDRAGPLLDVLAANDRYRASVRSSG
jgi:hypothetical protein